MDSRRLLSLFIFLLIGLPSLGRAEAGNYYGVYRDLPVGAVTPQGWLGEFLQRQRDGLGLHREYCGYPFDTCLWNGVIPGITQGKPDPAATPAWDRYEQTAYMVDGLYRCGLVLNDPQLKKLGEDNIHYVLDHPAADGRLGPETGPISASLIGGGHDKPTTPTQWPFAVFSRALIAYYSATHDPRLLGELTKHYLRFPDTFGESPRDVDNVEAICWLYGQTGNPKLLEMAERTWNNFVKRNAQWSLPRLAKGDKMHGHGVTVSEATKQPAILYLYTGKKEYLDAVTAAFDELSENNELADGVLTSDAGLSGKAPDHYHETCVISDYSWSLGYVLEASGDAKWADHIERDVLNAGLSVVDKQFKSLEYYAAPNQVIATQNSMTPTTGTPHREHQAYRPDFSIQCCTGNVHRFLPNYAARMWMSDGKGGLAAVLYGPATLHTKAGDEQVPVTIEQKTDYPFNGAIELKVTADKPVRFPLALRIPGWADGASITVNGQPVTGTLTPATFYKLDRTFTTGDTIALNFPMKLKLENPLPDSVCVLRGPLLYSLKMKIDAQKVTDKKLKFTSQYSPDFPTWDLRFASPWNYALALNSPQDLEKVKVTVNPVQGFPWTPETVPVTLTVPARRVTNWEMPADKNPALPQPPLTLAADTEQVELIPDGATQLRISVFPAAGN